MKSFISFGVAFVLRTIIPGVFGSLCLAPLVVYMAVKLNIYHGPTIGILLAPTALGIGLVVSLTNMDKWKDRKDKDNTRHFN